MSMSARSSSLSEPSTVIFDRSHCASQTTARRDTPRLGVRGLTCLMVTPDALGELWRRRDDDRGAVSLEQVLWFVAAGLSVAVVAGILWSQIRTHASTPINLPSAP